MVEVSAGDGDIGALRRDLNQVGERVEEVAEFTVLNEERLRRAQAWDCWVVVEWDERIGSRDDTVPRWMESEIAVTVRVKRDA